MAKNIRGFTIVELLIVVVIIGILAAIVVVAYNGITGQAKESKTLSAVGAWVKALNLYKVDNGSFPDLNSCFGNSTTYDGNGRCYGSATWVVQTSFNSAMSSYINGQPEPDVTQIDVAGNPDWRGAFYYGTDGSGIDYVYVMLAGKSTCPSIGGLTSTGTSVRPEGVRCIYSLD